MHNFNFNSNVSLFFVLLIFHLKKDFLILISQKCSLSCYIFKLLFLYTSEICFCACYEENQLSLVHLQSKLFQHHLFSNLSFSHWFWWHPFPRSGFQRGASLCISSLLHCVDYLGFICTSSNTIFSSVIL